MKIAIDQLSTQFFLFFHRIEMIALRLSYIILIFLWIRPLLITATSVRKIVAVSTTATSFIDTRTSKDNLHRKWQPEYRLRLKTAPLVGGPLWLPLHVKVIIENECCLSVNDTATLSLSHQWDLIPINATNISTLQQLLLLQSVPSQIRYRLYCSSKDSARQMELQELCASVLYNADTISEMSGIDSFSMNISICNDTETSTTLFSFRDDIYLDLISQQVFVQNAHKFCQSYLRQTNMQLHLITSNCWRFALQLSFHLIQLDEDLLM
jgi:hypothetical protein